MKFIKKGISLCLILPILAHNPTVHTSADLILDQHHLDVGPIDGTAHVLDILRHGNDLSEADKQALTHHGFSFDNPGVNHLRNDSLNLLYETTHFAIHYDLTGTHAVDSEDLDENNIPDYVDRVASVFEYVWAVEIDTLGYQAPPDDGLQGGSSLYDIYIANLPSLYYGLAYTTSGADEENACASYIEIRNNYDASWFQDKSELENIQVTAAHEFFHAIQFGYNCYEEIWMMEATAVWMEDVVYDHINDLYRYMPSWFNSPEKSLNDESNGCSRCYGSFIFFQYISEHMGGHETIRDIWDISKEYGAQDSPKDFAAIQDVLALHSSSFSNAFANMAIANRLLSNDASSEPYTYEEADDYPISFPPMSGTYFFSGETTIEHPNPIDDYGSRYFSIYTDEPMDLSIMGESFSNLDLNMHAILALENGDLVVRNGMSINIDPELGIDWISAIVTSPSDAQLSYSFDLVLSQGYSEDYSVTSISPNPFMPHSSELGQMQIDLIVITPQSIEINVYDILGRSIFTWMQNYSEPSSDVFSWSGKNKNGQRVSSGIYLIHIAGAEKSFLQKVSILK